MPVRYAAYLPMLRIIRLELSEANALVKRWHRHHKPIVGHRFSLGVVETKTGIIHGAVIVGRPVARLINWRVVDEVSRLVTDGTKNACSCLYSAAARVSSEMGSVKIQTYILDTETGISLKASGWFCEEVIAGGGSGWQSRSGRRTDQPICLKQRWAKLLNEPVVVNGLSGITPAPGDKATAGQDNQELLWPCA